MTKGSVDKIETFGLVDGPGIRFVLFLKGCPLRCEWCHNPEGQRFENEMIKAQSGCEGCGAPAEAATDEAGQTVAEPKTETGKGE